MGWADDDRVERRWTEGFIQAWLHQDVPALASLFADDLVFHWQPDQPALEGLPALQEYWVAEGDLQTAIRVTPRDPLRSGDTVIAELWVRMDYAGTDASDPEAIAKAHEDGPGPPRAVSGQLCVLAELGDDDRCRRLRQYQLGGDGDTEPPDWWGGVERSAEAA